jgi:muramoyltetrapeptide carboxypeptidase
MPLSRRTFLAAAGAAPFATLSNINNAQPSLTKPHPLQKGDLIEIVMSASVVEKPKELEDAQKTVEGLGYRVKVGKRGSNVWGYFAGRDEERAEDLNEAFADPEVKCIMDYQGGYGAGRILDHLDYGQIRPNPKILVGYSDVTALLLAIYAKTGMVTFHGPLATSTFNDFSRTNFQKVVGESKPAGLLPNPPGEKTPYPPGKTLKPGKAKGRLVGGNLSVICSILGSPFLPSFAGHLLFLEDIGEEPYRVDRMLNSLWISGAAKHVAGIIFGDFHARADRPFKTAPNPTQDFTMLQVLQNFADQGNVPCFCGAWIGHMENKWTLPIGVEAEMDADARTLTILEPAVAM